MEAFYKGQKTQQRQIDTIKVKKEACVTGEIWGEISKTSLSGGGAYAIL